MAHKVELNRSTIHDDPSDWPENFQELRILDNLLRCSICFEYFNIAVLATSCCHNYCSLCARKYITYKAQCPSCPAEMRPKDLKCNRVLDEIVKIFNLLRPKLLKLFHEHADMMKNWGKSGTQEKFNKSPYAKEKPNKRAPQRTTTTRRVQNSDNCGDRLVSGTTSNNDLAEDREGIAKLDLEQDTDLDSGSSTATLCDPDYIPEAEDQTLVKRSGNQGPVKFLKKRVTSSGHASEDDFIRISTGNRLGLNKSADFISGSSTSTLTESDFESLTDQDGSSISSTSRRGIECAICPVCGKEFSIKQINSHLDVCLVKSQQRRSTRSCSSSTAVRPVTRRLRNRDNEKDKKSLDESTVSKAPKMEESTLTNIEEIPSTSESNFSCSENEVMSPGVCSRSTSADPAAKRTASNQLLPVDIAEKRKRLPELIYSGLSEKQLRAKLKSYGLYARGDKKTLQNRLKNFTILYNSQCDAINPMPVPEIVKEVERSESIKKRLDTKGTTVIHTFDRTKTDEEKEKFSENYLAKHKTHFEQLIEDVKQRKRNQKSKNEKSSMNSEGLATETRSTHSVQTGDLACETRPMQSTKTESLVMETCVGKSMKIKDHTTETGPRNSGISESPKSSSSFVQRFDHEADSKERGSRGNIIELGRESCGTAQKLSMIFGDDVEDNSGTFESKNISTEVENSKSSRRKLGYRSSLIIGKGTSMNSSKPRDPLATEQGSSRSSSVTQCPSTVEERPRPNSSTSQSLLVAQEGPSESSSEKTQGLASKLRIRQLESAKKGKQGETKTSSSVKKLKTKSVASKATASQKAKPSKTKTNRQKKSRNIASFFEKTKPSPGTVGQNKLPTEIDLISDNEEMHGSSEDEMDFENDVSQRSQSILKPKLETGDSELVSNPPSLEDLDLFDCQYSETMQF